MVDDEPTSRDSSVPTAELVPVPSSVRDRTTALPGRTGDRYRLGTPLGHGGMGEILTARDEQFGREVAVKRMKDRNPSQHQMGRFFREATIQGRLDHPAIVPVHELGVDADGRPFFAMKKLTGTTLSQRIAEGHPRQRLLRAFADVCLAIEFAHERGVVHRDIKPDNIVLGDFGETYVLDWGVAKVLAEPDPDRELVTEGEEIRAERMTLDGTIIGTRTYMAPEQARAQPDVDGRADVYSLGCVLFEILTGEPRNDKAGALLAKESRPSLRAPGRDIPPELDELCVAATDPDRERRIQTPRELSNQVERFLDGDRDLALRGKLATGCLESARVAFAASEVAGDSSADHRRRAMRDAGRALALDPKLAGAGELVSRLMLEPPRERPPEMQQMIDADNLDTLRRMSRAGALGYVGFLSLLPLVASRDSFGYLLALLGLLGLSTYLLLAPWGFHDLRRRAIRIAISNALVIALVSRMGSPFLIAPAVGALATMALVFSPTYANPLKAVALAGTLALAVLGPWFAELAGLISPTVTMIDTGVVLEPPVLGLSASARYSVLVLYVLGIVGAAASIAYQNRRAEEVVRNRLHLQAWQLRQLVS